jgi:hypothetical protein
MRIPHLVSSTLVGLVLLATACGPQATAAVAPPPTEAPSTEPLAVVPMTGEPVVNLGQNDTLGSCLVDDKGITL